MFSKEILTIRKRMGLTQAELAQKLGVARNTVTRWECGIMGIRETSARLLRVLDAKPQSRDARQIQWLATTPTNRKEERQG
jgi:transcriptional regulator with XRE-family HTH domain